MTADLPVWAPSPTCRICGAASLLNGFLCGRCKDVYKCTDIRPGWTPPPGARVAAMHRQYDREVDGFRCWYSGVVLVAGHPWRSRNWDHRTPGDRHDVVLASRLVNAMKANLNEDQFIAMVRALARRFDGEQFDESAFPP